MSEEFYIIDLPIIAKSKQKRQHSSPNHRNKRDIYNGIYYPHGLGCKDWDNCFTCPKKDCTWTFRRAKSNNG